MFHSFLVQDIFNQFYLRSSSMNFRDTFCKGFTWDPIQKELHIGFYFGPGSSWMLLEIILDFTWDPVQKELYLRFSHINEPCFRFMSLNFTWGQFHWRVLRMILGSPPVKLCENCSHDLLANALGITSSEIMWELFPWSLGQCNLKVHQRFLSESKKVSWVSGALLMRFWYAFDALLMCFWCAF